MDTTGYVLKYQQHTHALLSERGAWQNNNTWSSAQVATHREPPRKLSPSCRPNSNCPQRRLEMGSKNEIK